MYFSNLIFLQTICSNIVFSERLHTDMNLLDDGFELFY